MQREVVLVTGQTGSGKTTWGKSYVQTLNRVIVVDANFNEFGVDHFFNIDDLVRFLDGKTFFRVSYTPRAYEWPLLFDIARIMGSQLDANGKKRGVHLVLEEADRLDDPLYFPEYDETISRGRHYGISIVAISLYPAKLPAMLRRQTTRAIVFRQIEPKDIAYLAEIVGEIAEMLPELKQFHYIDWSPSTGGKIKKLGLNSANPIIMQHDEKQNQVENKIEEKINLDTSEN